MPSVTMILGIMPVCAAVIPWSVVGAMTCTVLVPFTDAFAAVGIVTCTVLWSRRETKSVAQWTQRCWNGYGNPPRFLAKLVDLSLVLHGGRDVRSRNDLSVEFLHETLVECSLAISLSVLHVLEVTKASHRTAPCCQQASWWIKCDCRSFFRSAELCIMNPLYNLTCFHDLI